MTTVSDFISFVKANGIARQNRFRLTFNLPQAVIDKMGQQLASNLGDGIVRRNISGTRQGNGSGSSVSSYALAVMCQSVALPGLSISTQDMVAQNYVRKLPFDRTYSDFDCTFISSRNMIEKKALDTWATIILNDDHTIAYFDDYVVDILIEVMDETDRPVYEYKLTECYPFSINPLSLDRAGTNQYQVFSASFHFTKPAHVESDFGTLQKNASQNNTQTIPGVVTTKGLALRLPEQPAMTSYSAPAIDVMRSIEIIKANVERGLSPKAATTMFRGILRELDGIETFSSFEHGALTAYIGSIVLVLESN